MTELKKLALTTDDFNFKLISIEDAFILYCDYRSGGVALSKLNQRYNVSKRTIARIIKYFDVKMWIIMKHVIESMKVDIESGNITNGICTNIEYNFGYYFAKYVDTINSKMLYHMILAKYIVDNFLQNGFVSWDKFSGDIYYPVPAPKSFKLNSMSKYTSARQCYYSKCEFWSGEYGELRIDLFNHLYKIVTTKLK